MIISDSLCTKTEDIAETVDKLPFLLITIRFVSEHISPLGLRGLSALSANILINIENHLFLPVPLEKINSFTPLMRSCLRHQGAYKLPNEIAAKGTFDERAQQESE